MNPLRKKILSVIGRMLGRWDLTRICCHIKGNHAFIRTQRVAQRFPHLQGVYTFLKT